MKILYNDKENEKFFVEMSYSDYGDITGTRYNKILYGVIPGEEIKLDALQRQDSINRLKAIYEHMAIIKSNFDGLPQNFDGFFEVNQ